VRWDKENMTNLLTKILNGRCNGVIEIGTPSDGGSSAMAKASVITARIALTTMAVLFAGILPHASAQTAPAYVVYSQTPLSGTGSPNPTANFNEFRGHAAANSRGDFFVEDGSGSVWEYPANGGNAILLFTDSNSSGAAGTAVDPSDNLFVGSFSYGGPNGNNDANSLLYQFPSTNGSYPAPYIFGSNPPGSCTPASAATSSAPAVLANTGVCAVGFFQGAIYYYWQGPIDTAVDGQGNNYTISGYTSHDNGDGLTIFQCQLACAQQLPGNGASAYTGALSTSLQSLAANYTGDLYAADASKVYIIPAKSPNSGNTPAIFDATYNQPYGVSFDASGNLYVADTVGIWEVPAVEASGAPCKGGTDTCKITASSKYLLIPVSTSAGGLYSSYLAPAIDNRGNIVFSPYYGYLLKYSLWAGNFPATAIGSAAVFGTSGSNSLTFTVSFDKATTLAGINTLQGTAPSTEFVVTPGTCTVGSTFAAGSTCTFSATFTPSGLGVRTAAVVITDATGNTTTTYLSGTGMGTGVSVDPGTPNQIGSGFKKPMGVAVDGAGNVYVADSTANTVQKYPVGNGSPVSIGTSLNVPTGVAVDAGGNVYIVNQGTGASGGSVVEVPVVNGVLTNSAQKTLVSGLNLPTDIIIDANANLFITATGGNQVLQLSNASRSNASAAQISHGYGLNGPTGLAMDPSGNLYVADTGNNRVLQLGDGFQIAVGSSLIAPTGVATDPSGSVIIADGSGRLIRVPNESFGTNPIGLNQADQQVLSSPLSYPYSVRTDNSGNLYVSDNSAAVLYQLQRTTGTVNFGNWNLNTMSDAQGIVFSNIGTADVTVGNPPFLPVPANSEFAVTAGSGSTACGAGLFHSGYQCTVLATFAPTTPGSQTYPLVFNTLAQNSAAPTVNLVGTGTSVGAATLKLTQVAPTTTSISYGQQIIISAKVTPTGSGPIPTGYLDFQFNGQNQRPILLDATGTASITFNGLNAGSNTLSAYYEGDKNYASMNSTVLPLIIQLAASKNVLTVVGDSAVPLSVQPTDTITLTDVLTPSVVGLFTGTVTFIDVATNTPLSTPIRLGSPDPTTGLYTASYSFQPATQTQTSKLPSSYTTPYTYNVVAVYSGNSNYLPTTSAVIPYTVVNATYTITQDVTNVTASASTPGTVNLTVTDFSNFQGNVALQCSGLPANAYCVFRPASAQLVPAVSSVQQNTPLLPLTIYPVPVVLQIKVDQNIVPIESSSIFWIAAVILGFGLALRRRVTASKFGLTSLAAVLCIAGLTTLGACSSSTNPFPTPPGSYAVTITGTATPLTSSGAVPPCSYKNCSLPPDPVTNPSINVVQTLSVNLTVK
jgi:sugar lactone lactonase YvrE